MLFKKKKNYLTRKYMMDKYENLDKEKIFANKNAFINFLKSIEEEFYNHDFEVDKRYVCIGRHRLLIDEMSELYFTKEQCIENYYHICPTKWCFWNMHEMILYHSPLKRCDEDKIKIYSDFYKDKCFNESREIYEKYFQDGIISLNERDMILYVLNMIKDSLSKCDDNLEWVE